MPREMQPMMAVATAEAMDSVEGSHFANGRRHFCYQIGLEKKTQTKDSMRMSRIIFILYLCTLRCQIVHGIKTSADPFEKPHR